jgi:hypothetical protein
MEERSLPSKQKALRSSRRPAAVGASTSCAIGQPRLFAFSGPVDDSSYIQADGSLLAIAEYPALFKLYGTQFGGDGQQTFRAQKEHTP